MIILLSLITVWNSSCQKEAIKNNVMSEEPTAAAGKKPDDPGFAEK